MSAYVQVSKNTFIEIQEANAQRLANATDLNGVRIELAELTPDSLQRKAIDAWK